MGKVGKVIVLLAVALFSFWAGRLYMLRKIDPIIHRYDNGWKKTLHLLEETKAYLDQCNKSYIELWEEKRKRKELTQVSPFTTFISPGLSRTKGG